jgi:hypothetical protein
MFEFISGIFFQILFDSLPKLIGTTIRWCYYGGKKRFSVVLEEDWNKRVGLITIILIIVIVINLS